MELQFRIEAKPAVIARLNRTVHTYHQQGHPDVFNPYDYETFNLRFERVLQQTDCIPILVQADQQYIGYALVMHRKAHPDNPFGHKDFEALYIDQMSIEPAYQGQGVGTKLLAYIRQLAIERGIHRIQLDVWQDNVTAKHLYQKMGFETYREVMEWKLDVS